MTTDDLALATVAECRRAGVLEFCLCAGSRNSELVRRCVESGVKCWHFFEERSAAFFALGRVRITGRPVAVVTTSGTAAVELFPAFVEAHYQGLPLLAVTADRPLSFRYSGAPQAINQENLFGSYPEIYRDVTTASEMLGSLDSWKYKGPGHLNVCLGEPKKDLLAYDGKVTPRPPVPLPSKGAPPLLLAADLILLGDLLPAEQVRVKSLLQHWHGPVWAEAASGLRAWLGARLVRGGEATLRHLNVRTIVRFGGVPSCRFWRDLETRIDVRVVSVSRAGYPGLARKSEVYDWSDMALEPTTITFQDMTVADLCARYPLSECGYLSQLNSRIASTATLFLGNSLSIRQWNLAAPPQSPEPDCHVLRGANGIDGNLSYFYGLAADSAEAWAIVGDLTALYDLAAPWVLGQLPAAKRRIVIMNNGGGLIFRRLPSLQGLEPATQQVIENTHDLRFQHWAAQWGMSYLLIKSPLEWPENLPQGDVVIEMIPDEASSASFWEALGNREREVFG